ncbi:MAG TPA: DoxX family protein [Acidimicrobiales bacterium]|nr:DoxX family protein [Acidimicrobiales bacterium]
MSATRWLARPMISAIFVAEGVNTLRDPGPRVDIADPVAPKIAEKVGLPTDTKLLVKINAGVQLGAGTMFALGKFRRLSALALIGSMVPTTYAAHRFWEIDDPAERSQQKVHFMKNLGMLGGLVLAAVDTEGSPSVGWRARRAAKRAGSAIAVGSQLGGAKAGSAKAKAGAAKGRASKATSRSGAKAAKAAAKANKAAAKAAGTTGRKAAKANKAAGIAGRKAAKAAAKANKAAGITGRKAAKAAGVTGRKVAGAAATAGAGAGATVGRSAARLLQASKEAHIPAKAAHVWDQAAPIGAKAARQANEVASKAALKASKAAGKAAAKAAPVVSEALSSGAEWAGEALSTGGERAGELLSVGAKRAGEAWSSASEHLPAG